MVDPKLPMESPYIVLSYKDSYQLSLTVTDCFGPRMWRGKRMSNVPNRAKSDLSAKHACTTLKACEKRRAQRGERWE